MRFYGSRRILPTCPWISAKYYLLFYIRNSWRSPSKFGMHLPTGRAEANHSNEGVARRTTLICTGATFAGETTRREQEIVNISSF